MPDRTHRSQSFARIALKSALAIFASLLLSSCSNSSGPSLALTFTLYTLDGNYLPAAIRNADGKTITIGIGRLQGTDAGPSCGMSLQLITGPITSAEIPDCKLVKGEEFRFKATLTDSRFPSGSHEYRFISP